MTGLLRCHAPRQRRRLRRRPLLVRVRGGHWAGHPTVRASGKTPQELVDLAHARGFGPDTKAGDILAWLKEEFDLGRGHGMAVVHVVKNGPQIGDRHVGTTGSHRDESNVLRLDGKAARR